MVALDESSWATEPSQAARRSDNVGPSKCSNIRRAPLAMIEVTVQKLSIRFGEALALDDVDLSIGAGELFLLLGASGSGKTTLLRCIAGFTPPHAGAVLFSGEDVTHLAPHKRNAAM